MNRKIGILAGLYCVIAVTLGVSVNGQPTVSDKRNVAAFNTISREEVEMLIADVARTNPEAIKRFAEDPKMKKVQLEDLKQLLAFASQAQKEGLTKVPTNHQELDNIRSEVAALNYDREVNKDKGPMPPLGYITENQVKEFWEPSNPEHEADFQKFMDAKVTVLKEGNPQMKDREISEEEKTQARDFFAKVEIYEKEYNDKVAAGRLPKAFQDKVDLQVKLQQAQFLARIYSEKVAEKAKVTDEDIAKYLAEHPEFNTAEKKAKANEILKRVKAGEDFAALANEFSEDPGNKNPPQGGIYKDVTKGKMVAPFEQAALALESGQVAPNVVETDFGYHIIKLEKKGLDSEQKEVYDVRHILIATTYKEPENHDGVDIPVKSYVRSKLETEKEKQVLDEIIASNNIKVPEDFTVPKVADAKVTKKPPLRKKRPVKKSR
ncbi:MAG: peptidylprolyl isomerase [Saprospiraceae bacterium]|nr:peptidylprolyl isomerase [Pyrinomonadaceae bacterium]